MKGNVFIAWGGNKNLADSVANEIRNYNDYSVQVGGDTQEQMYIANQIIEQIKRSSIAILLVENAHKDSNSKIIFKPNLMFEWGYIIAKLKPKNIHVFLVGLEQKDLPSDLAGAWAQSIEIENRSTETVAIEIASIFNQNMKQENISKLEIMESWVDIKKEIQVHSLEQIYGEREMANFILHSIQSAYYYNEIDSFRDSVKQIKTKDKVLQKVQQIVINCLEFYSITDNQQRNDKFEELDDIVRSLDSNFDLKKSDEDIDLWLHIIKYDFIGLCYMFMAEAEDIEIEDKVEYNKLALEKFNATLSLIKDNKSREVNDEIYFKLWEGYIYRNIAVISSLLNELDDVQTNFENSYIARNDVLNYFKAATNNDMLITNFKLEFNLIQIEKLRYIKDDKDKNRVKKTVGKSISELHNVYYKQYALLELLKREYNEIFKE